jgi:hypothetical protein
LLRAEQKGMDVGQAKLQSAQARDALLKARVSVHTFRDTDVERDTDVGLAVTRQTYTAGEKALAEWKFRRIGLGLSLAMIALTLVGLRFYITVLEKK